MNKKYLISAFLASFILAAVLVSWFGFGARKSEYEFETVSLESKLSQHYLSAPGTLSYVGAVPLFAESDGMVEAIKKVAGEPVRAGEVIAYLKYSRSEYKVYRNLLKLQDIFVGTESANTALDAAKKMNLEGYLSNADILEAESRVNRGFRDVAEFFRSLESLRARTEGRILRAPFDGYVGEVFWQPGDLIQSSRQMTPGAIILPNKEQYAAKLEFGDDASHRVRTGMPVEVRVPYLTNDLVLHGVVSSVSRSIREEKRGKVLQANVDIKSVPEFLQGKLKHGMRVMGNAMVVPENGTGVFVPKVALNIQLPQSLVHGLLRIDPDQSQRGSLSRGPASDAREIERTTSLNRDFASETFAKGDVTQSFYILKGNSGVVEVQFSAFEDFGTHVLIDAPSLTGKSVVMHYSKSKNYLLRKLEN